MSENFFGLGDGWMPKKASAIARKHGACLKFGSRPIGWYQQHAFSALRFLEAQGGFPVALRHGVICFRPSVGAWQPICSPSQLFDIADARSRS